MSARTSLVVAKFALLETVACDPVLSALENLRPSVQRSLKNGAPRPGLEGQGNSAVSRRLSDISTVDRARRNPAVPAAVLKAAPAISQEKGPLASRAWSGPWVSIQGNFQDRI